MQDKFSVLLLAKNKRLILAGNENVMKNNSKNIYINTFLRNDYKARLLENIKTLTIMLLHNI